MAINYNNKGLVDHANKALKLKTKYMWGGVLRSITKSYIQTLRNIYGVNPRTGYTESRYAELASYVGKGYYGCDCVGLIKSYYWSGKENGGVNSPYYGQKGYPDVNAGTMYSEAKVKGEIKTLPERPGVIVYCKSHPHVGVYVGKGFVIESTLSKRGDGVVKTKLSEFAWEYWFECPYISYEEKQKTETITARLAYPAKIRDIPSSKGKEIARLTAGNAITYIKGTDTRDSVTGYVYVKLYNSTNADQWIVKSAIKM